MGKGLLIIVSGLFIIFGIIQRSLSERQKSIIEGSANYATDTQSEIIANSMADLAFAQINEHPGEDIDNFDGLDMMGGKGSVTIKTEHPFAPSNPFIEQKIIKATGKFKGKEVEINAVAQRRAFSIYAYFSMVEKSNLYFITGDTLNGPTHTNSTLNVHGSPVFNGKFTSPNKWNGYNNNETPEFNGGADFSYDYIDLPVGTPELDQQASNGGLNFNKPIDLNFYNDKSTGKDVGKARIKECTGSYNNSTNSCDKWGSPTDYTLGDYNGIISTNKFIRMKGTINGDYTVHSKGDTEIMGDVNYFDDPSKKQAGDPPSDDFLGIVSEGQTVIDKNAHKYDYNGAGLNDYTYNDNNKDLDIQASIMALGKHNSFYAENYANGLKGSLNLLGGSIQYEGGPTGTFSGGSLKSGYQQSFTYDERFLGRAPRGFPPSDIYDYISYETDYK